jgi:Lactate racemase N-terminal domain
VALPHVVELRRAFPRPRIEDLDAAVRAEWAREGIGSSVRPGMEVAIAAGSRGIADVAGFVRALARCVRDAGASPFIVPAMGSHGGATAEGQVAILASLGVTEDFCEAPVRSSMEVVELGTTDRGTPVFLDRNAHRADGVIPVVRVKAHTDFRGKVESGLLKMCAIGLGKHAQALALHSLGVAGIRDHMVDVGLHVAGSGHLLFGLAIVENAYDEAAIVEAVPPAAFLEREADLLQTSKGWLPRLPLDDVDVLVVDRMGKNYSGTGMDTNVLGRFRIPGEAEPEVPRVRYIVVCDLTEESHGNAAGIGLADLTTERLVARIDRGATYENVLTSTFIERGKIPIACAHDRAAIEAAVRCNWGVPGEETRLVRIPNTLHLDRVQVAERLVAEVLEREDAEVAGDPFPLPFGPDGHLAPFGDGGADDPRRGPWEEIDGVGVT